MTRRVYFAFYYKRDIWRVNVVRKSWVTQEREAAGFFDASLWEEAETEGDAALKRLIKTGLKNTSATAVLIGKETSKRKWVRYEISESHRRGNGLLGVYIHNIKDQNENTDAQGSNYFGEIGEDANGDSVYFWQLYPCYDWKIDDGYNNFGDWVEKAAEAAGK